MVMEEIVKTFDLEKLIYVYGHNMGYMGYFPIWAGSGQKRNRPIWDPVSDTIWVPYIFFQWE